MDIILNILIVVVGFLSFIPVMKLFNTPREMKYRCLKFLVNATFAWTVLIFVERFVDNASIIYYAHMLGYPLKFLMATFMLCTVYNYVESKMPKLLIYGLGVLFLVEYIVAITNGQTEWLLQLEVKDVSNFIDLYTAQNGVLFIYHLILTYLVLFAAIGYLGVFLRKRVHIRQYKVVSRTMVVSVIFVLSFNLIQLFTNTTTIDLTYVTLVIASFTLYQVIYSKDMVFNLKMSGRGEILSNMREMYILTDSEDNIVDISNLLQEKYEVDLSIFIGKKFSVLLENLKSKLVVYEEYNVDEKEEHEGLDHLHLRRKEFSLKTMTGHGVMYLLYDETQIFTLLRELNKLSNYDNMTGLHNRNFIENKLKSIELNNKTGIVSLDLNGLKANNDYLGHERGDYLLKKLSIYMKDVMKSHNNYEMARIGGDEFMIIVENSDSKTLNSIKNDILELCEDEDIYQKVSVSIGLAINKNSKDIYELIHEADQNMYEMKQKTSKEYSVEIVKYATNNKNYIR